MGEVKRLCSLSLSLRWTFRRNTSWVFRRNANCTADFDTKQRLQLMSKTIRRSLVIDENDGSVRATF